MAWLANGGEDDGRHAEGDPLLPRLVRSVVGALGVPAGALAALLLMAPEALIPHWPWTLGALTARVVAAIVAMQGVAFVGIAIGGRWSVAKVMFEAQLLTTPLIALAVLRSHGEFAARGASAPAWAAGVGVA